MVGCVGSVCSVRLCGCAGVDGSVRLGFVGWASSVCSVRLCYCGYAGVDGLARLGWCGYASVDGSVRVRVSVRKSERFCEEE